MNVEQRKYIHSGLGKYLCAIVGGIFAQFLLLLSKATISDEKTLTIATVVCATAGLFFGIYELVGLHEAGKSNYGFFKVVFYIELIDAIFDFVIAIVQFYCGSLDNSWAEIVSCVISISSFAFVMSTYAMVAKDLGYSCKLINLAMIFYILGFIGDLVTVFANAYAELSNAQVAGILGDMAIAIVGWILSISVTVQCYKKTKLN